MQVEAAKLASELRRRRVGPRSMVDALETRRPLDLGRWATCAAPPRRSSSSPPSPSPATRRPRPAAWPEVDPLWPQPARAGSGAPLNGPGSLGSGRRGRLQPTCRDSSTVSARHASGSHPSTALTTVPSMPRWTMAGRVASPKPLHRLEVGVEEHEVVGGRLGPAGGGRRTRRRPPATPPGSRPARSRRAPGGRWGRSTRSGRGCRGPRRAGGRW